VPNEGSPPDNTAVVIECFTSLAQLGFPSGIQAQQVVDGYAIFDRFAHPFQARFAQFQHPELKQKFGTAERPRRVE